MSETILICGAGGYVGGKMVQYLLEKGHTNIRAVSSRPVDKWIFASPNTMNESLDLRDPVASKYVVSGADVVYNFAAKVGGIGYIGGIKVDCLLSSLINTNLLVASSLYGVSRYFYSSSACVYGSADSGRPIHESTPLLPSQGYGQEKVFGEQMCKAFQDEKNLSVAIARYTGIYGPGDDIKGAENKDHAPASLCRQVIKAKVSGKHEIKIWGDGEQTRDFLFIDDCIEATYRITQSGKTGPFNVGGTEVVSINQMVTMLEDIVGIELYREYDLTAPRGVANRCLDMTELLLQVGWTPTTPLRQGLEKMYHSLLAQYES